MLTQVIQKTVLMLHMMHGACVRLIRTARTVSEALTRIGIGVLQQLRRILQRSEELYAQRKIGSIIGLL